MAKKIKEHISRRKFHYLSCFLIVGIVIGIYFSFFFGMPTEAVSGVVLVDQDTTGYGLTGQDFTVTWTPGEQPAGYEATFIYIVSSTSNLTTSTLNTACNGSACVSVGYFSQHSMSSHTVPAFMLTDSANQAWATGVSYVAWVYTSSTNATITSSTPVEYAIGNSDTPTDTSWPMIDHSGLYVATASANAFVMARIVDDQTVTVDFANVLPDDVEYVYVYYGSDVSASYTTTTAAQVQGTLFKGTIPSGVVPAAGGTLEYFVEARDSSGNKFSFCASPMATTTAACRSYPFVITTANAGTVSVSGIVTSGGSPVPGASVYLGGVAKDVVTTDGSGAFTITNLANNQATDIRAYKDGYCPTSFPVNWSTNSVSGLSVNINLGNCGYYGGQGNMGADSGSPTMMFSNPGEGMMDVPITTDPFVAFDRSLDSTSINDSNAADTSNNVYLTTDDGTTKVAGSVVYCPDNATPGCSSLGSNTQNAVLFVPTNDLTINTFYSLVITGAVKGDTGMSIMGSRPGGGHEVHFNTTGANWNVNVDGANYGTNGQFMPPYVRTVLPSPGIKAAPNTKVLIEFNEAMNASTLTEANLVLQNVTDGTQVVLSSISIDPSSNRFAVLNPGILTADKEYEVRIKGAVANASGLTLGSPAEVNNFVFYSRFEVAGTNDVTAPTIYPMLADGTTGVSVSGRLEFGFSEPMAVNTLTGSTVLLYRGATAVSTEMSVDPGRNSLYIMPSSVLTPNSLHTVTFTTTVSDLAGNTLASNTSYTFTTGASDTTVPNIVSARCDDWSCEVFFNEPMNNDAQTGSHWASSTINSANWAIQRTAPSASDITATDKPITYEKGNMSARITGLTGLASTDRFRITLNNAVDKSGNVLASPTNQFEGTVESSANTYGNFGGGGMFAPPMGGTAGGSFTPEGFGTFTGEQMMKGGGGTGAYPFNQIAGQDCNVFQVRFTPDVVVQDDDRIIITFPQGTEIAGVKPDDYSPYKDDFNQSMTGVITYDTTYSTDGVSASSSLMTVSMQLEVTGTPNANDEVTLDLRGLTNPSIPKGPESGGYTVTVQIVRAGQVLTNKTSAPYFINQAGTNTINVSIYAGTVTTSPVAGADGDIYMWGGGPAGPMDELITLTDGIISAVDGDAAIISTNANLPDGCYNFGTEPFVTLGSNDYFGQFSPEPVCVFGGNQTANKEILLTPAGGDNSAVTTTIKLAGIADFGGVDMEIFAGGPGRYVVKTLSNVGVPNNNGYNIKLPTDGMWHVGIGPAMPKGSSMGKPPTLPGVPPPPAELKVSGVGTATPSLTTGSFGTPPGVSFNDNTDTITFTFASADKAITGTVTDGSTALAGVEVFVNQQGFGMPTFATTDNTGAFTLNVSEYGSYEIGAFKDGMMPVFKQIEVKNSGGTTVVYYQGKAISGGNPLIIKIKKPDYYISGKVLDSSNNAISYAPVFATNIDGDFVGGGTNQDGSYTIFVDAGVWTVKSTLPPDKTDTCGILSKTVTVTTANKTNQNLTPSVSTCYTLSGTVSVGGSGQGNVPLFIDEWDAVNNRPSAGGMMRGASTDSDGAYSVKLGNGTYRVGTWSPEYGELSANVTINGANITNGHITVAATSTITFAFTGGTSGMNAFVELKNDSDKTKRIGKKHDDLSGNLSLTVTDGVTYNYFVNVMGFGDFTGTATGGDTVTIDVSTSDFVTVSGSVQDSGGNALAGALVTLSNSTTDIVKTAVADENGNYTVNVKADTYDISTSLAGYIPGEVSTAVSFTTTTSDYDFVTGQDRAPLASADYTIEGILKDASGNAMTSGYVWAENANGVVVEVAVDSDDGGYSVPVTDGTWTIKGTGPLSDETALGTPVVISGADDVAGNNITLTADATKIPESASGSVSASTGGSVDDSDASGIKLTAGAGVLQTSSGNVTVNMEKTYTAPDSDNFQPLSNATFEITATGNSTIKSLKGNAEIQIDYTDLIADLPTGITENDLQLMYYSPERGEYIPVEGGYTIDPANNTVTGSIDHFTELVLAYVPPATPAPTPDPTPTPTPGGSNSIGVNPPTVVTPETAVESTVLSEAYVLNEAKEVTVGASVHTITILSATAESAQVKIQSEPLTVTLAKDVSQDLDTDADGIKDLRATYLGLDTNGAPKLSLVNLTDANELSGGLTINSGAYETSAKEVILTLSATSVKQMAISNSTNFDDAVFVDYATTTAWTLTAGNGEKTVYVKFRSVDGGTTLVSDTITLTGQTFDEEKGTACALTKGGAYKISTSPAVYYITEDCTKRVFRGEVMFFSYFDSWEDVKVVTELEIKSIADDVLTFMPWGLKYNPKHGALVKVVKDPKVYLLLGTSKYWITSESVFTALKYAWNWIEDISQTLLDKYTISSEIKDTDQHPDLTLIKYANSSKVYKLEKDAKDPTKIKKRHIKNEAVFNALGYRWDRIITVDEAEVYDNGDQVKSAK